MTTVAIGDANAQTTTETDDARQRQQQIIDQQRTGDAALGQILGQNCQPVVFGDILAAPDDIALNYCFALQRMEQNDFKSAASTLERILLIAPGRTDVRLLYALVLYRLDNVSEAEREFRTVREAGASGADQARIDKYLEQIEGRQKRTRQSITFSFGSHFDTNRNAAPSSDEVLLGGSQIRVTADDSRTDSDVGYLGSVRYDINHDLGLSNPHKIFGSFSYFQDEQTKRDELDIGALSATGGFQLFYPGIKVTPLVSVSDMKLSRQHFYRSYAARVRTDKAFHYADDARPVDGWFTLDVGREKYSNISENTTLINRTGNYLSAEVGAAFWVAPNQKLSLKGSQKFKTASRQQQAYRYTELGLGHTWLLGSGQFLQSDLTWGVRQYASADPTVSPRERREVPKRLRVTYGTPIGNIVDLVSTKDEGAGQTGDFRNFVDDMLLSITGEYLRQDSNITNYEYDNARAQVMISKRFEF